MSATVNYGLLHLSDGLNIQELGLGTDAILGAATTKSLKNIPGFLLAADTDQPTWGLGEKPDDSKKNKEEEDLESDRESPLEGRLAAINE